MLHQHTGHKPDRKNDCPGCEAEFFASEQRRAAAESYAARLDEAEAKLAYLAAGCVRLSRDELVQKITEVGSARWSAEPWLQSRMQDAYQRGIESVTGDITALCNAVEAWPDHPWIPGGNFTDEIKAIVSKYRTGREQ